MMRNKMKEYNPSHQELSRAVTAILEENIDVEPSKVYELLCAKYPSWRVNERRMSRIVKRNAGASEDESMDDSRVSNKSVGWRARGVIKNARRSFRNVISPSKKAAPETHPENADEIFLDSRIEITSSFEDEPLPIKTKLPESALDHDEASKDDFFDASASHESVDKVELDEKVVEEKEVDENLEAEAEEDEQIVPESSEVVAIDAEPIDISEAPTQITVSVENDFVADKEMSVYKDDNDFKKTKTCAPCEGCAIL